MYSGYKSTSTMSTKIHFRIGWELKAALPQFVVDGRLDALARAPFMATHLTITKKLTAKMLLKVTNDFTLTRNSGVVISSSTRLFVFLISKIEVVKRSVE
jgi:hypothetical protein